MPGHQRIIVVTTAASEANLRRLRAELGRDVVALSAPTAEAKEVVTTLGIVPRPEVLLAPVRFPEADRGHRLAGLIRSHAVQDRFRNVLVVADPATSTLLIRDLAPDQLPTPGAVTVVLLPRGNRPVAVRRAVVEGMGLGLLAALGEPLVPIVALPGVLAILGLALLVTGRSRHLGRELLLALGVAVVVIFLGIAGSARFPGAW